MLPFRPMTATEHKARWQTAIKREWELEPGLPGEHPEHVLDFHDGLRLIVSTDLYQDNVQRIHVSASVWEDSQLHVKMNRKSFAGEDLFSLVQERVTFLGGPELTIGFVSQEKGVPHWFCPPLLEVAVR